MSETLTLKAEATRVAILDRAESLFRTLGYQKTAVADVARELRMSPANVYRFFPSKSAICEAIAKKLLAGLTDTVWSIARGPGSPENRLRLLFTTMQAQTLSLFFTEARMHDMVAAAMEEHWGVVEAHVHDIDNAIRHIVLDGQQDGSFARLDPGTTGKLVHMMMLGFAHPRVIEECSIPAELPALASGMADLAIRALRVNPTTDGC